MHKKHPKKARQKYKQVYPRQVNVAVLCYKLSYLSMKGTFNLGGTVSPKKAASSAIFNKALLTISPKYIPEIDFSKICKQ